MAKYCLRAMPGQHFINPSQLVQAACAHKKNVTLTFNRLLKVVKVHVHAKFHQANCSGS